VEKLGGTPSNERFLLIFFGETPSNPQERLEEGDGELWVERFAQGGDFVGGGGCGERGRTGGNDLGLRRTPCAEGLCAKIAPSGSDPEFRIKISSRPDFASGFPGPIRTTQKSSGQVEKQDGMCIE
jgi:hypothetical protein